MSRPDTESRPEPLTDIARSVSTLQAGLTGLVTALISGGVISLSSGQIANAALGLVPGLLATAGVVLGAFGVAHNGRDLVTPLADPRDDTGAPLLPAPVAPKPASPSDDPPFRSGPPGPDPIH